MDVGIDDPHLPSASVAGRRHQGAAEAADAGRRGLGALHLPASWRFGHQPQACRVPGVPDAEQMPGCGVSELSRCVFSRFRRLDQCQGVDMAFIKAPERQDAPPKIRQHMQRRQPMSARVQRCTTSALRQSSGQQSAASRQPHRLLAPLQAEPARGSARKKRSISAEASGPLASVYVPLLLPPAQA